MRHTPFTDSYVEEFRLCLSLLHTIEGQECIYLGGAEQILDSLQRNIDRLEKMDIDKLKSEFWDLSNEFNDPTRLRNIYKVKFKELLSWTGQIDVLKVDLHPSQHVLLAFIERHNEKGVKINFTESMEILSRFMLIVSTLSVAQSQIKSLMEQCDAFAGVGEDTKVSTAEVHPVFSNYRIASKRKTDFIKLLSAMYDNRLFVDETGSPVTNKQKLMESFGEFLGEDFSAYSASLSQAKTRDEKTFLKPFKEIEKEALRYFNAVGE